MIDTLPLPCSKCSLRYTYSMLAHLAALASLGLETTFDGADRTLRTTGLASHEVNTVFLCKKRVWRAARLACNIFN